MNPAGKTEKSKPQTANGKTDEMNVVRGGTQQLAMGIRW